MAFIILCAIIKVEKFLYVFHDIHNPQRSPSKMGKQTIPIPFTECGKPLGAALLDRKSVV